MDRGRLEETLFQLLELRAREGLDYGSLLLLLSLVNLLGILSILQRRGAESARSERRAKAGREELAGALAGILGATGQGPASLLAGRGKEGPDPLGAVLSGRRGGGGHTGGEAQRADVGSGR
ncbi:MAG: hypothetical protein H5T97_04245, partial [Firmicutes bacterium]|nr:hypothetical protein [Bacillota bacterium]